MSPRSLAALPASSGREIMTSNVSSLPSSISAQTIRDERDRRPYAPHNGCGPFAYACALHAFALVINAMIGTVLAYGRLGRDPAFQLGLIPEL
jgi:hypothetical protein